jgi:NADPH:quinone reductase-like Zn-dependent oxidoreductase
VIDHSKPLAEEYAKLGIGAPAFIFSVTHSSQHRLAMAEIIAPMGRICLIDDFPEGFDILAFKMKVVSLHWEFMFSRPMFQTPDMIEQHKLLTHVAELIDGGKIRTTLDTVMGPITAENLRKAHAIIESNRARGKIVLEGFPA